MKRIIMAGLLMAAILGCKGPAGESGAQGPKGDTGATGSKGDTGNAGASLLKTYSGTIPSNGSFTVNVPEINNKKGTTFVECYWAYSTSSSIYTKMADGWLDDTTSLARRSAVSWDFGQVYLSYMTAGDLYRIDVYSATQAVPMPSGQIGDRLLW